jgi:predicted SnoaL-like aldol condensation-catalyzing enzyme
MPKLRILLVCGAIIAGTGLAALAQEPPVGVKDQQALLKSHDPKLAATKKLVFDMYRTIVQAGRYEQAGKFFTKEYIQHNPNVKSGLDAIVEYIRNSRPQREIPAEMSFPLISLIAEGDMVMVATLTYEPEPDKPGERYATTHFDLYRIENGLIAEHWDHVPKSAGAKSFDPNTIFEKKDK